MPTTRSKKGGKNAKSNKRPSRKASKKGAKRGFVSGSNGYDGKDGAPAAKRTTRSGDKTPSKEATQTVTTAEDTVMDDVEIEATAPSTNSAASETTTVSPIQLTPAAEYTAVHMPAKMPGNRGNSVHVMVSPNGTTRVEPLVTDRARNPPPRPPPRPRHEQQYVLDFAASTSTSTAIVSPTASSSTTTTPSSGPPTSWDAFSGLSLTPPASPLRPTPPEDEATSQRSTNNDSKWLLTSSSSSDNDSRDSLGWVADMQASSKVPLPVRATPFNTSPPSPTPTSSTSTPVTPEAASTKVASKVVSKPKRKKTGGVRKGSKNLTNEDLVYISGALVSTHKRVSLNVDGKGIATVFPNGRVVDKATILAVAEHLKCSPLTVRRKMNLFLESPDGKVTTKHKGRRAKLNKKQRELLKEFVVGGPPLTSQEIAVLFVSLLKLLDDEELTVPADFHIAASTVRTYLKDLLVTYKLVDENAPKAVSEKVHEERRVYCEEMVDKGDVCTLVFIDECTVEKAGRRRAWAPRGVQPVTVTDHPRCTRVNLVLAISPTLGQVHVGASIDTSLVKDDFTALFIETVEKTLARIEPTRKACFIMDNARVHGKKELHAVVAGHPCNAGLQEEHWRVQLRFLPRYSPFLNPCENVFGHLKSRVSTLVARYIVEDQAAKEATAHGAKQSVTNDLFAEKVVMALKQVGSEEDVAATYISIKKNKMYKVIAGEKVTKAGNTLPYVYRGTYNKMIKYLVENPDELHFPPSCVDSFKAIGGTVLHASEAKRMLLRDVEAVRAAEVERKKQTAGVRARVRCGACGVVGHNKRTCATRVVAPDADAHSSEPAAPASTVRCSACGVLGHNVRTCKKRVAAPAPPSTEREGSAEVA